MDMRIRTTLKKLSILCSSAMLLACADLNLGSALSLHPTGAAGADAAYRQARQQHLAQRYEEAIKSYQAALAADEGHINARNGLAALYAEKGDFAQAIPIWRALTEAATMSSGPGTAFLFGNLGHAYFLNGDYDNALPALEKACLLDPLNQHAWQRLGDTLKKLGQDERAGQMLRQAAALRQHDFRADYAAVGGSGSAAIDTAVKATARPEPGWGAVEVVAAADGMLELKRTPASRVAAAGATAGQTPQPLPTPAAPPAQRVALLEIRNGNGVTGMARTLSQQMGDPGLKVVRLTNDRGFNVRVTRVEYQPAFRAAAERLAERVGGGASAVEVDSVKSSNLRLVIGHDLRGKFALRPFVHPEQEPTLAQVTEPGKSG
jgi:tetratricopeptide (TPR) repeat protein